ncbi:hypothetical protein [Janthinobacterium sp. 17J80-10]|uniref:hypothetical protein n=1 Tax=Janthinobacterium sp. 17J80-10 TaxID=2497863 RepID=UPI0010053FA6|nr:hypothetical protein [Janthinobacterium sp. 17J80-10]QAU33071.1 hypothetical protein EKL02_02160 [Janthinobacterium sp. 17J80-10]
MLATYRWQLGVFALATLAFAVLLASGLLQYEIWGQIDYLHRAEIDLTSTGMYAHLPRYIVVSPSYILADLLDLDANAVFGWYVYLLVCATSWLWLQLRIAVARRPPIRYYTFLVPFLLAMVINGRFAFGLFGLSLILFILVRARLHGFSLWQVAGAIAGLLFTSVSSGIFTVGLAFLLLTVMQFMRFGKFAGSLGIRKLFIGLVCVAVSIPLAAMLWIFLMKNISYYGEGLGGIVDMVSHGFGLILNPYPVVEQCLADDNTGLVCLAATMFAGSGYVTTMMAISLVSLVVVLAFWLRRSSLMLLARRGVGLACLGGVFGLTTLLSVLFILPVWIKQSETNPQLADA